MTKLFSTQKIKRGTKTLIYQKQEFQLEAGAFYFLVELVETGWLVLKPHRVLSPMVKPYQVLK